MIAFKNLQLQDSEAAAQLNSVKSTPSLSTSYDFLHVTVHSCNFSAPAGADAARHRVARCGIFDGIHVGLCCNNSTASGAAWHGIGTASGVNAPQTLSLLLLSIFIFHSAN